MIAPPDLNEISAALFGRPDIGALARALDMSPNSLRRFRSEPMPGRIRAELLDMLIKRRDRLNAVIDTESRRQ